MKSVSAAEMRELDRRTIEEFGISGEILMQRAGLGVAEAAMHFAAASKQEPLVQIFAGKGNNGGDAFVAAYCISRMGCEVEVLFAGDSAAVSGDALTHLNRMREEGIELRELATADEWNELLAMPQLAGTVLIDGLLGTGITGSARGPVASAIDVINRFSRHAPVVAIDIPSGMNADTGIAEGSCVIADLTVTMAMPKRGLLEPCALDYVGRLEVIDIGIPEELSAEIDSPVELITESDIEKLFARRRGTTHKGSYGHALIIGGSPGYAGAVAMAAMAALRSGTGLVSMLVPETVAATVAGLVPEAMVHAGKTNPAGSLAHDAIDGWGHDIRLFSSILIGPGMTKHSDGEALVRQVAALRDTTVVMDADALNILSDIPGILTGSHENIILTPHPGEMARLLKSDSASVQNDRFTAAIKAVEKFGTTIVLKGAGSIVAQNDKPLHINMTGNPGMATGGMGDVLAGLMTGLAAQGLSPFDAARAAVYVHGRAGDSAVLEGSQHSLISTDIIKELPTVLRTLVGR
jgi:NAD(P)H-hydrate epimerase